MDEDFDEFLERERGEREKVGAFGETKGSKLVVLLSHW